MAVASHLSSLASSLEFQFNHHRQGRDALGRLATVTHDGVLAESYAYDANGNRTAHRAPARGIDSTITALFDTEDRATHVGDATYTYTPDGYLALKHSQEGTTTYAYTAFGELARAELPDGRAVTYTYDASGRRTSKAIDGTVTERYLWADTTRLLAIADASGDIDARFLYADSRVPYAADTDAGRIFFAYDQVGSLRAVTDEAGTTIKTVTHDAFGNVIFDSNSDLRIPLGFAGGLSDEDTGLTLFGARDYDAELGRWLAKDPIGFAGGDANLYGYCLGDPVNLVDPSGLLFDPEGGNGADGSRRYWARQRLAAMEMTDVQRRIAEDIIANGPAEAIHKSSTAYSLEAAQKALAVDAGLVAVAAMIWGTGGLAAVPLAYVGTGLAVGGASVAGARCAFDSEVGVIEGIVDGAAATVPLAATQRGALAWIITQAVGLVDPDAFSRRHARVYTS